MPSSSTWWRWLNCTGCSTYSLARVTYEERPRSMASTIRPADQDEHAGETDLGKGVGAAMEDLRHRLMGWLTGGVPKEPVPICTTIVKKGSSARGAPGAPNVRPRDSMRKCLSHPRVRTDFPARPGIQSARRPQLDERQEVPPTRLSGQRPRSAAAPSRAAPGAGTRCSGGRTPNLAGRPPEHQHAGLPGGRPLLAVRAPVGPTTSVSTIAAPRCGTELHSCAQCMSFDPGSRFECMQPIPARISPKNARNGCALFSPRTTVERETTTPRTDDARKAFDDLFKF